MVNMLIAGNYLYQLSKDKKNKELYTFRKSLSKEECKKISDTELSQLGNIFNYDETDYNKYFFEIKKKAHKGNRKIIIGLRLRCFVEHGSNKKLYSIWKNYISKQCIKKKYITLEEYNRDYCINVYLDKSSSDEIFILDDIIVM